MKTAVIRFRHFTSFSSGQSFTLRFQGNFVQGIIASRVILSFLARPAGIPNRRTTVLTPGGIVHTQLAW